MKNKWDLEKENLENLIKQKISYEEIGRRYGCSGANIKKVALRLGIELEHRRKINDSETFGKGIIKVSKGIHFPFDTLILKKGKISKNIN